MQQASGMRPTTHLDASAHRGVHRAAPARPSPPMSRSPSLGNLSESVQAYGSVKELEMFRNKIVPALNNCAFRQLAVIDDKLDKACAAEQQLEGKPGGGIRPHGPTAAARQRPTHLPTRSCSLRRQRRFTTGHGRPSRPAATIPKPLPWLHELDFPGGSAEQKRLEDGFDGRSAEPEVELLKLQRQNFQANLKSCLFGLHLDWYEQSVKGVQVAWSSACNFDPFHGSRYADDESRAQRDDLIFQSVPRPLLVAGEAATIQHRFDAEEAAATIQLRRATHGATHVQQPRSRLFSPPPSPQPGANSPPPSLWREATAEAAKPGKAKVRWSRETDEPPRWGAGSYPEAAAAAVAAAAAESRAARREKAQHCDFDSATKREPTAKLVSPSPISQSVSDSSRPPVFRDVGGLKQLLSLPSSWTNPKPIRIGPLTLARLRNISPDEIQSWPESLAELLQLRPEISSG